MKGNHRDACAGIQPRCLCNTCKRDVSGENGDLCCNHVAIYCPVIDCPDYEPDDEDKN